MGCPNLPAHHEQPLEEPDPAGMLYAAAHGGGAWAYRGSDVDATPSRIGIAAPRDDGSVRVCESAEAAHSSQSDSAAIMDDLGVRTEPVRLDSQCKYAVVGRGQADAYLRLPTKKGYVEKIWDHAAGKIIAQEAGATVSDIAGVPLDFSRGRTLQGNRGIVCAASGLHDRLIEAIAQLPVGAPV
jgi:3'(2'), 5'-bisphosphate nucleotidase